jgi:hypothetical protein
MLVTKYYTLVVLALLAAHHIFHISRIKVKGSRDIVTAPSAYDDVSSSFWTNLPSK